MKITDVIIGVLDIIKRAEETEPQEPVVVATIAEPEPAPEEEIGLSIIQQLAGLRPPGNTEPGYANEPCEDEYPLQAAFPNGTDLNRSKNPADIRSNSISMYPGFQAEKH
jgi:hypothetical protein